MNAHTWQPLSPLDGRYRKFTEPLTLHLSENALNRARMHVEIEWIILLTSHALFNKDPLTEAEKIALRRCVENFDDTTISRLSAWEQKTRHDIKAVEYVIREHLETIGLQHLAELTHFAATSEDINNLAYALTIREAVNTIWIPALKACFAKLSSLARQYRDTAMLARTHGQPATPTTLGKECAVFAHRLYRLLEEVQSTPYVGKFNGATGTFSAHVAAAPEVDWIKLSQHFVESFGLEWNPLTTQIESHDWQIRLYSAVSRINNVLHNICTDMWAYISLGYFQQIPVQGATGSSTMPHKVNPIHFENAEANLELSSGMFETLSRTLATTRMQRDLTDSTTQRNVSVAFGYSLVALKNLVSGLERIDVNVERLQNDLDQHWETLTEAIQTVVRAEILEGNCEYTDPYELIKNISRGERFTAENIASCLSTLNISPKAKERLFSLTPQLYTGHAALLVDFLPKL